MFFRAFQPSLFNRLIPVYFWNTVEVFLNLECFVAIKSAEDSENSYIDCSGIASSEKRVLKQFEKTYCNIYHTTHASRSISRPITSPRSNRHRQRQRWQ